MRYAVFSLMPPWQEFKCILIASFGKASLRECERFDETTDKFDWKLCIEKVPEMSDVFNQIDFSHTFTD